MFYVFDSPRDQQQENKIHFQVYAVTREIAVKYFCLFNACN